MRLPAPGEVVDEKYLIESQLGQGGMGVVFAGRNLAGEFPVAIKWLLPEHANNATSVARFRREAQMAAYVRSRNVVQIYDVGVELPYFVMELLHGTSLRDLIMHQGGGGIPLGDIPSIYPQVLQGVSAAHRTRTPSGQAVIHRDLKPDNVFLAELADGIVPTVLDFGIARLAEAVDSLTVNTANMILGTPQYMAREQFFAQDKIGPWTDIHALGVILYEMVAGRRPFDQSPGQTPWDLVMKVSLGQFEPLVHVRKAYHDPRIARLDAIVAKAMAPEIEDRYQSVSAFSEDLLPLLEAFTKDHPATMSTGMGTGMAPRGAVPFVPPGMPFGGGSGTIRDTRGPGAGGPPAGRSPNTLSPVVTTLAEEQPIQSDDGWTPDTLPVGLRGRRLTGGMAVLAGAVVAVGLLFVVRLWDPMADEELPLELSPSSASLGTTPASNSGTSPEPGLTEPGLGTPELSGPSMAPSGARAVLAPGSEQAGDGWEPPRTGRQAPQALPGDSVAPEPPVRHVSHAQPRRSGRAASGRKRQRPAESTVAAVPAQSKPPASSPVVADPEPSPPSSEPSTLPSPRVAEPEKVPAADRLGSSPRMQSDKVQSDSHKVFNISRPIRRTDAFSKNRPGSPE